MALCHGIVKFLRGHQHLVFTVFLSSLLRILKIFSHQIWHIYGLTGHSGGLTGIFLRRRRGDSRGAGLAAADRHLLPSPVHPNQSNCQKDRRRHNTADDSPNIIWNATLFLLSQRLPLSLGRRCFGRRRHLVQHHSHRRRRRQLSPQPFKGLRPPVRLNLQSIGQRGNNMRRNLL